MHASPMEMVLALNAVTTEVRSAQPGSPVVAGRPARDERQPAPSSTGLRRRAAALLHTLARTLEPVENAQVQCGVAQR